MPFRVPGLLTLFIPVHDNRIRFFCVISSCVIHLPPGVCKILIHYCSWMHSEKLSWCYWRPNYWVAHCISWEAEVRNGKMLPAWASIALCLLTCIYSADGFEMGNAIDFHCYYLLVSEHFPCSGACLGRIHESWLFNPGAIQLQFHALHSLTKFLKK